MGLLVFSYSISYLRARGEGLGVSLSGIGIMERAERMSALFFAAFLASVFGNNSEIVLIYTLIAILILVFVTAVHRFVKVYSALKLSAVNS